MAASHRSIHPDIPGAPWYVALLIAITATAIGYGIDAGHKELTHVFAGFYIAGCVAAVLAVRQDSLFTAIIQPPLILFCAVPGAYWLFHGRKIGHLKDVLINCGYPLIERFPLMLGTAGGVLLIGLGRWYFGTSHATTAAANTSDGTATGGTGVKSLVSGIVAKLHTMLRPDIDAEDADEAPDAEARRSRTTGSAPKARRAARSGRSATRSARTRSRRARQPPDHAREPAERLRRPSRRSAAPGRDYDAGEPPRRSPRRPRPETDPDMRAQPPREARREPRARRGPYERPTPRSGRFDGYGMYDPPGAPGHLGRYDDYERYDRYEPPYEPRRRHPTSNGTNPTHHPIPPVRYRETAFPDEPRADPRGADPHAERRGPSRPRGRSQGRTPAEFWEYDARD